MTIKSTNQGRTVDAGVRMSAHAFAEQVKVWGILVRVYLLNNRFSGDALVWWWRPIIEKSRQHFLKYRNHTFADQGRKIHPECFQCTKKKTIRTRARCVYPFVPDC